MKQFLRLYKLRLLRLALVALVVIWAAPAAYANADSVGCSDFNGDGKDELAIGVPGNRVGNVVNAGAVHVLYGLRDSQLGLSSQGDQLWTQDGRLTDMGYTEDIWGIPQAGDAFGAAVASGDFNGDGYCDLASGAPGEDLKIDNVDVRDAGVVIVFYGSATGLSNRNSQFWSQSGLLTHSGYVQDLAEKPDAQDGFGAILIAADFNGDSRDDLAIGIPSEDIVEAGEEVPCPSEGGDVPLGSRTALMCPPPDIVDAGAVQILTGSRNGLSNTGSQLWTQMGLWTERNGYSSNIQGQAEPYDLFGFSLAAGNFNGDARDGAPVDDLAIGVPYETFGEGPDAKDAAGAVHVLFGARDGLSNTDNQLWTQNSSQVADQSESYDHFGWSLATGNFDAAGGDDLAIGVPGERTPRVSRAGAQLVELGAVHVLYGSSDRDRLSGENSDLWTASSTTGVDIAQEQESYGSALAAGDFDGDRIDDLVIGDPRKDVAGVTDAGAAHVLYGAARGLAVLNSQFWTQDIEDIRGAAQLDDRFGSVLGTADFNGDGRSDLAIGIPFETVISADAGMVNVIYGSANQLSAAGNQKWHQGVDGIWGDPTEQDHFGSAL